MDSVDMMRQLFKTDDPKGLFNEVYNKSLDISGGKNKNEDRNDILEENEGFLPPVQLSKQYKTNTTKIPKKYMKEEVQNNKNADVLKNLLGETYYNNLLNKPAGSGSIVESFVNNIPSNNPEDYEVVENQPKQSNQISLTIEGKSYNGKIVQNKKGQILFLINNNQAFVLTPSTLKTVSKK